MPNVVQRNLNNPIDLEAHSDRLFELGLDKLRVNLLLSHEKSCFNDLFALMNCLSHHQGKLFLLQLGGFSSVIHAFLQFGHSVLHLVFRDVIFEQIGLLCVLQPFKGHFASFSRFYFVDQLICALNFVVGNLGAALFSADEVNCVVFCVCLVLRPAYFQEMRLQFFEFQTVVFLVGLQLQNTFQHEYCCFLAASILSFLNEN
jgi:hypothetical protein